MAQDTKIFEDRISQLLGSTITVNGVCYKYTVKGPCFENHEVGGVEFVPATPADIAADSALNIANQGYAILEELKKLHLISMFTKLIFREDLSTSNTKFFQNNLN